jgi:hypothetical protein
VVFPAAALPETREFDLPVFGTDRHIRFSGFGHYASVDSEDSKW